MRIPESGVSAGCRDGRMRFPATGARQIIGWQYGPVTHVEINGGPADVEAV